MAERLLEDLRRRHEVGVEDQHELAGRALEARVERPRLEAGAVAAVQVVDVEALRAVVLDGAARDPGGGVGRVVEHLDLEQLLRVAERGDRGEQPVDDVHLVVDRELDRDPRQHRGQRGRRGLLVLVLEVEPHHHVAVEAHDGEDDEGQEVEPQDPELDHAHRLDAASRSRLSHPSALARRGRDRAFLDSVRNAGGRCRFRVPGGPWWASRHNHVSLAEARLKSMDPRDLEQLLEKVAAGRRHPRGGGRRGSRRCPTRTSDSPSSTTTGRSGAASRRPSSAPARRRSRSSRSSSGSPRAASACWSRAPRAEVHARVAAIRPQARLPRSRPAA